MQSSLKIITFAPLTRTQNVYQVRHHVKIYPWRRLRNVPECHLDPERTPYSDKHNINEFKYKKVVKPWMRVIAKDKDARFNAYTWNEAYTSSPKVAKETAQGRLKRFQQCLTDRGYAREQKSYYPPPPEDVTERIIAIYKSLVDGDIASSTATQVNNTDSILGIDLNHNKAFKFDLITRSISAFGHDVPSSYLNDMSTIADVVDYFSTEVRGVNPFDSLMVTKGLPDNLTFLPEPARYDAENDTFFKANAMPGVISKVHGLRASKKYPILNQNEFQWPDV